MLGKSRIKRLIVMFLSVPLIAIGLFSCDKGATEEAMDAEAAPKAEVTWPANPTREHVQYVGKISADAVDMNGLTLTSTRSVAFNADASKVYIPTGTGVQVYDSASGEMSEFLDTSQVMAPYGITYVDGRIYVIDTGTNSVKYFNEDGEFLSEFGATHFVRPVALSSYAGKIFVADAMGSTVSAWDMDDNHLFDFAQANYQLAVPTAIAVNSQGLVYVTNLGKRKIHVYNGSDGTFVRSFIKQGEWVGQLMNPKGIAIDSDDNVYVADSAFDSIQVWNSEGKLCLTFGSAGVGMGQFSMPAQIAIDSNDRIYVPEYTGRRVQIFQYVNGE